ncbi:MAG: hypothetical protein K8S00_10925 [Bacteroidales bacterium]|nr:hypothetical protein [Bacteroidales bacterium]
MILRKTILNISFLLLPLSIIAQNAGYVKLSGQVKLRGSNNELKDVSLVIFSGGEKVNEIKTNSSETFQIRLEFNKKYLVEVNKAGLVKLKYEIVTQLPESEFNKIHPFYLRVYLFPNYSEMDMSIYGGLSSTIKYDESSGKFAFNYTGSENLHQRIVENDRVILGVQNKNSRYLRMRKLRVTELMTTSFLR